MAQRTVVVFGFSIKTMSILGAEQKNGKRQVSACCGDHFLYSKHP